MAETIARQKFACPACGGEAHWNPGKQALVCPYCGTVSPGQIELAPGGEEVIREHELATALRGIPADKRGWQTARTQVRCQHCNAISVFDPARVGQRCDFCGAGALVPYEQMADPISPESLLPMKVAETQIRESIRNWYGSRWFAPNALKSGAITDRVRGVYVPYWTFDAHVHADWTADSGYYYWVDESYRDSQGRTQTRRVRKTRWQSSSGSIRHFFDDELVPATRGVHLNLLRSVEPFPTRDLVPFKASYLSGWLVERYQLDLVAAAQHSREQMDAKVRALCGQQVPGDTYRNLQVQPDYSAQTFKHILAPIWLLTYDFHGRAYQVVINGYTAAIAGEYPKSWIKITLAVFGVIIAALLFALVARLLN